MELLTVFTWLGIAVLLVAAVVAVVVLRRTHTEQSNPIDTAKALAVAKASGIRSLGRVWVVVNPTKPPDLALFKEEVDAAVVAMTGEPASWIETSIQDPGTGQAITALKSKPKVVIAAGGDGTVRAVAAGMAHSGVPMALLPMGTGNLLARNLGIPLELDAALGTALSPVSRRMDLAWLKAESVDKASQLPAEGMLLQEADAKSVRSLRPGAVEPSRDEYAFTVIAGVGFDGQTMADTDPNLKKRIGWSAYVVAATKSLRRERMKATVTIYRDREEKTYRPKWRRSLPAALEEAVHQSHTLGAEQGVLPADESDETRERTKLQARTILFANCGVLPFAVLAPDASLDDGKMDVITIDTRGGLLGWALLSAKVFGQSAGLKPVNVKNDLGMIQFRQAGAARVDLARAQPIQVDGDPIGSARTVRVRVDPGALVVRVPRSSVEAPVDAGQPATS